MTVLSCNDVKIKKENNLLVDCKGEIVLFKDKAFIADFVDGYINADIVKIKILKPNNSAGIIITIVDDEKRLKRLKLINKGTIVDFKVSPSLLPLKVTGEYTMFNADYYIDQFKNIQKSN